MKTLMDRLKCLNSQDYLLLELLGKELIEPSITCCDVAIRKRESDINIFKQVKAELQKRKEEQNDIT